MQCGGWRHKNIIPNLKRQICPLLQNNLFYFMPHYRSLIFSDKAGHNGQERKRWSGDVRGHPVRLCDILCKSQRQEHSSPGTNLSDSNGLIIFSSAAGNRRPWDDDFQEYFLPPHWNTESDCWPNRNQGALDQLFVCCFVAWATKLRYCCDMARRVHFPSKPRKEKDMMKTITLEHRHFSSLQNTMSAITSEHSPKTGHHGYWQAQHFGRLRVLKRCVYQKKAPFRACFLTFCFQL